MKNTSAPPQARQFVGRTEELALLEQAVTRLGAGQGGAVLLSGEPGIGKSRLAQELAQRASARDLHVHWGFCWEAGEAPAYWPWQQALGDILHGLSPAGLSAIQGKIQPLRRILPGVPGAEGAVAEYSNAEVARFQFLSAVTSLLSAAAEEAPLLLILEDLHAADEDSVLLFQHIAKHCARLSLLLLGTFRESDARRSAAGPHLWKAMRQAWEVRLEHLSYEEVRAYLQARAQERAEEWIGPLWDATEGNPLYVVQLVDLLLSRSGAAGGGRNLTSHIPDGIKAAIRERLDALPSVCADLLTVSSIFGREFSSWELAAIRSLDTEAIEEGLLMAMQASLLQQKSPGEYRFSHILIREVLHESLAPPERRRLHKRCAARLEQQRPINWPQLAQHLREAGPEGRRKAMEAWQRAAEEAEQRAAFRSCVACWENALELLGQGPSVDPKTRLSLLMALGRALVRAGEVQPGRQQFLQAFQLARILEDANAMAEAALGYGSVFLYAQVDPQMIALLQEALGQVGEKDSPHRAKLQARLAAAMQPAKDPSEPIARAREAIAMARRLGDPETLRVTLRFGISALMDLGPPKERLALNREHIRLAEQAGDDLEAYRGHLRLFIDATELGDPEAIKDALAACERIAEKTGLPHYRWQATACRAMWLTVQGKLTNASDAIDKASALAEEAQDPNARLALTVQRIGLARDWQPVEQLLAQLPQLKAFLPHIPEIFLLPGLACFLVRAERLDVEDAFLDNHIIDKALILRGDPTVLPSLGEYAAAGNNRELAEKMYHILLPRADLCAHWGLTGLLWDGPVSRVLALLADTLDLVKEVEDHFQDALARAEALGAQPMLARVHYEYGRSLLRQGRQEEGEKHLQEAQALARRLDLVGLKELLDKTSRSSPEPKPPPPPGAPKREKPALALSPDGELWRVDFAGQRCLLKDSRGMQLLAALVAQPEVEIHVLDLQPPAQEKESPRDTGDAGEVMDARAKEEYRRRVLALREEIEEAERLGNSAAAERARSELEFIARELSRAYGLGGRARRSASAVERARINTQRRVKDAIQRIASQLPQAGRYLERSVKTGVFCSYCPD